MSLLSLLLWSVAVVARIRKISFNSLIFNRLTKRTPHLKQNTKIKVKIILPNSQKNNFKRITIRKIKITQFLNIIFDLLHKKLFGKINNVVHLLFFKIISYFIYSFSFFYVFYEILFFARLLILIGIFFTTFNFNSIHIFL